MRIKREGSSPGTGAVAELFGLRRAGGRRSRRSRFDAIAEGKLDDVVADIGGPARNETHKTPPLLPEQSPPSFLATPPISRPPPPQKKSPPSRGAATIATTAP